MKITRRKLRQLIAEAMFNPRAAFQKARQDTTQYFRDQIAQGGSSGGKARKNLTKLDTFLGSNSKDTIKLGHDLADDLGDYDSPTGTYSSYQDIEDHDQAMQDASLEHKKASMIDEFETYMAAEGPEIMSALYKLADTPGVHLYVTTDEDYRDDSQAPGSEVVRDPEGFYLMAISSGSLDFSNEVGKAMGIDFGYDEQDAIVMLMEQMNGGHALGHVPEGYQYAPDMAFIAWLTHNNPNLQIYVDP